LNRLDELLAWMRANGVKYAAVDGLCLEIDKDSQPETPLTEEELERLRHLKGWGDGFRDTTLVNQPMALDPDMWGGRVPSDVYQIMKEPEDE